MNKLYLLLGGLLVGAGGMFFLDPARGRRRRARVRLKTVELAREARKAGRTARKASQRTWARVANGSEKVVNATTGTFRQVANALH
jgi:hypothetical protein